MMNTGSDPAGASADDDVIYNFISASTWHESRWILEQHHWLLNDSTMVRLGRMVVICEGHGEVEKAEAINQYLQLLGRCREVGLDTAFAEVADEPIVALSSEMVDLVDRSCSARVTTLRECLSWENASFSRCASGA